MTTHGLAYALVGHACGDFVLAQNDWVAARKEKSTPVCALHCLLWTAAVMTAAWWWPLWGGHPWLPYWLAGSHFAIDRLGLARRGMRLTGQEQFATGPMSPWSVVVVDQCWHAATLLAAAWGIGAP